MLNSVKYSIMPVLWANSGRDTWIILGINFKSKPIFLKIKAVLKLLPFPVVAFKSAPSLVIVFIPTAGERLSLLTTFLFSFLFLKPAGETNTKGPSSFLLESFAFGVVAATHTHSK